MTKDDYSALIRDFQDPYSAWIREKEIKRNEEELMIPEDYCLFMEKEGEASPGLMAALKEYGAFTDYDFIYTDEDEVDPNGKRHDPFFKWDYAPDTLKSFYYPGGLTIVKRELTERAESESGEKAGSLSFLRECGLRAKAPLHIPEVLYHSFSHRDYNYEDVPCREKNAESGSVSVVILSKDHPELLGQCLKGLYEAAKRESAELECIVIDNGSDSENTDKYLTLSKEYGFKYIRKEEPFIYSKLCNEGAREAKGRFLLFLNDDIEVPPGTDFLKTMMAEASGLRTGAVGVKLLYPGGDKIQHCGITLLKTGASHKLSGYEDSSSYYRGVNRIRRNVFAVTGACLMVERDKFNEVNGFDEAFSIAYTDVDLCCALLKKNYYNVCLNDIFLYHHESLSRKSDKGNREKFSRLKEEREKYYEKYGEFNDPWYSVNLTTTGLDYRADHDLPWEKEGPVDTLTTCSVGESESALKLQCSGETYRLSKDQGKKVLFSIDVIEEKAGDAYGNEDFFEISGWAFVHGKPGYLYDVSVLILTEQGYYLKKAIRLPREDTLTVFPDEKDILLSGFSLKINAATLKGAVKRENIRLVLSKRDLFGALRGYIVNG